jgi:hypothetical protein
MQKILPAWLAWLTYKKVMNLGVDCYGRFGIARMSPWRNDDKLHRWFAEARDEST